MPIPKSLEALMDHGVVEQVVRPLLSGKEAEVYLVVSEGAYRVAKVYKEAHNRTFRNRATYTEGRKVRNSRDQRAMAKRTSHGKAKDEAAWRSTEVDMIYKLEAAGVRVPKPYHFVDGILIMELVQTGAGEPAPRLGELELTAAQAKQLHATLLAQIVRMLCAGVVHGDLSEFNVLLGHAGPCIIDFPQSVHAASNANARNLLLRDVSNLHRFLERFVPGTRRVPYAEEMWELYEKGELTPTTQLTGKYTPSSKPAEVDVVLAIIEEAKRDERIRQQRLGGEARGYSRKKSAALLQATDATQPGARDDAPSGHRGGRGGSRTRGQGAGGPQSGRGELGARAGNRAGPSSRAAPDSRTGPSDRAGQGNHNGPSDRAGQGNRNEPSSRTGPSDRAGQGSRGGPSGRGGPSNRAGQGGSGSGHQGRTSRGGRRADVARSADRNAPGDYAGRSGDHAPGSYGHHGGHGTGAQVRRDSHAGRGSEAGSSATGRHGGHAKEQQGHSAGPGRDRRSGRGGPGGRHPSKPRGSR